MTYQNILQGPDMAPVDGAPPQQVIIFLHGVGANGADLMGLAPYFQKALPQAHFLSPNAPERYDMMPPDFMMNAYQWFSLQDRSQATLLAGVRSAADVLHRYLDAVRDHFRLPAAKIGLVGFSQGTMTALYTALRRTDGSVGAVAGFSGLLIHDESMEDEITARPPVLLVHGSDDTVVPFAAMEYAVDELRNLSVPVTGMERPDLGHGIDNEGIDAAVKFLAAHLA